MEGRVIAVEPGNFWEEGMKGYSVYLDLEFCFGYDQIKDIRINNKYMP